MTPKWLENAVFYEIYPQSFYDTNGDGIGDFEGIIRKLDYIKDLGCNALWLNPCFDSPFKDAGYDVRDYKKTAPRYGSNEDLQRLFAEAHAKGIRVILDLVPGHTSEEHPWFTESGKAEPNEYSNRYIWTSHCFEAIEGYGFIGGERERNGTYLLNFFKCQPALNYGFLKPAKPWQLPPDHPDCIATREAMKDVIRFWLDRGCDGFRVDMAASLVKNDDEQKSATSGIWRNIRAMLDRDYPEAVLVSEWSDPERALAAGFHADFLLNHPEDKGYRTLLRRYNDSPGRAEIRGDRSFFKKDGGGDIRLFLDAYLPQYEHTRDLGYISLITGNHDTIRARFNLSPEELKVAYGVLFTLPGAPFLYYGDEIGMRYLELPTKEGGYYRTGARSPMQWAPGKNLGFSEAAADKLYLPVDGAPDAPTVEGEGKKADSLFNTLKAILRLRREYPELQGGPNLEILYAEPGKLPFVYRRGSLVLAANPSGKRVEAPVALSGRPVLSVGGGSLEKGRCTLEGQSFVVFGLS
jgi:maltose alpha-D-glucosyltransferase/alpha-amylase